MHLNTVQWSVWGTEPSSPVTTTRTLHGTWCARMISGRATWETVPPVTILSELFFLYIYLNLENENIIFEVNKKYLIL